MKLNAHTRGQSESRGKPRVFLTCHPKDACTALPLICEDILRHANCAVWHDEESESPYDPQELYACLDEMQLVVFAVTSRFLYTDHRAKDVELKYALEKHIPVLPILLESGLASEFNRVTNTKIQVVTRHISDPTATPYDDVLDLYLKSVLVGDELAEQVRNAFDAYVFLSYRKKDRRHAQRLMHLIHENRQFRDIAIWYDEFLVPGENYNDAIRDAFEKSGLFALAVTPNLLEPGNYVMKVEFPLARDRKKEKGDLEIVPVELYETERGDQRTDRKQLEDVYHDIPPVQDEHMLAEMYAALLQALERIAKKENDGSARHRFFIGLAYLCGIDVEINQERALELIRSAAEDKQPCYDATEKLVDMYLTGDGVARDEGMAVYWQKKLCEQYRSAYELQHDPDAHMGFGTKYFRSLISLSDLLRDLGDDKGAFKAATKALEFGSSLGDEVGRREMERDTALIYNRLGGLCRERGDLGQAEQYYQKALEIYSHLAKDIGTTRARRDMSVSLERLGDISRKRKDCDQAEIFYRQAQDIRASLAGTLGTANARRDLSAVITKMGNVFKDRRDYAGAIQYYEQALDLDRVLAQEQKSCQAWDDYAVSLVKIGDIRRRQMQYQDAEEELDRAIEIFEKNVQETGSIQYRKNLAAALEKLGKTKDALEERKEAEECFVKAVSIREQLVKELPSSATRHELAVCCFQAADMKRDLPMMKRALSLWEEISVRHPEYQQYADSARQMLQQWK